MRYYGAAHLHSSYSYDAKIPLRELKELFRSHGCSFALMSEHTDELTAEAASAFVKECRELSDETFLFIPGFEVSFKDTHILMFGCETFHTQHATPDELISWKKDAALAVLAHPHRNGYRTDHIPDGVLDGIEVWNSVYDGKLVPRTGARLLYARLSTTNARLLSFAGWDVHRAAHAGGPKLTLEVDSLTEQAVLKALTQGAFVMESSQVVIGSDGGFVKGSASTAAWLSLYFVTAIRLFKVVNRVLSWFGIQLPSALVAHVRRRI